MLYILALHSHIIVSVLCPSLSLVPAHLSQLLCLNCIQLTKSWMESRPASQ